MAWDHLVPRKHVFQSRSLHATTLTRSSFLLGSFRHGRERIISAAMAIFGVEKNRTILVPVRRNFGFLYTSTVHCTVRTVRGGAQYSERVWPVWLLNRARKKSSRWSCLILWCGRPPISYVWLLAMHRYSTGYNKYCWYIDERESLHTAPAYYTEHVHDQARSKRAFVLYSREYLGFDSYW
jgi:hypothetical protein